MGIFGKMLVLSFLSRVLISLRYQNGYCAYMGVEEPNATIMGGVQCLNSFLSTQIQTAPSQRKRGKKAKNAFCKINFFIFAYSRVGHSSEDQYRLKKSCGEGVMQTIFFDFSTPVKVRNFGNFVICLQHFDFFDLHWIWKSVRL